MPKSYNAFLALGAGALLMGVAPPRAQEQIDATVGTVGTVANDGPLPQGGKSLVNDAPITSLKLGGRLADQASMETIDVTGQAFAQAVRVRIKSKAPDEAILLQGEPFGAINGGATLFFRLWGRVIEGGDDKGESKVQVMVHDAGNASSIGFFGGTATFGTQWRRFDLPIPEYQRFDNGQFSIRLGGEARTLELAGLEAINYGNTILPQQLPFKRITYVGREADAAWRKDAQARIEKYRKGDLSVAVVDAKGKPIRNAQVRVKMTRHAYGFGSVLTSTLFAKGPKGDSYRAMAGKLFDGKLFNVGIVENDLKWRNGLENPTSRQRGLDTLKWMQERGIKSKISGPLVWPSWRNEPDSLKKLYLDTKAAQGEEAAKAVLRKAVDDHIVEIAGGMRDLTDDWEVVNEPFANHDLMDILGRDEMVRWFQLAHQADPNALLSINENTVESGKKLVPYSQEIQFLINKGAPIGAVGLQGHVGALAIPRVQENIEAIAKLGLPIKITEFDMVTPDEQLQAEYTRDFMTLCFSIPQTTEFMMWGFRDNDHWLHDAPLYYADGTLKPSGQAFMDLVLKTWWTNAQGTTGAQGNYTVRGFMGNYDVTVTANGKTQTIQTTLPNEGRALTVRLN